MTYQHRSSGGARYRASAGTRYDGQATAAAPPAFLFDAVSNPVNIAFSTRKLHSDYAGACMRVRRSSNNAEQDIGFAANNVIDTAALLSFCGSDDGFVRTWYDQVAGHDTMDQTDNASQPRIVVAGAVQTLNGQPAVRFSNTPGGSLASYLTDADQVLLCVVAASNEINKVRSTSRLASLFTDQQGYDYNNAGSAAVFDTGDGTAVQTVRNGASTGVPLPAGPIVVSAFYDGANGSVRVHGGASASFASSGTFAVTTNDKFFVMGNDFRNEPFIGLVGELAVMTTASAADRDSMEASMATFFGTP